jgi:phosphoethanolamine N-methyltransferase
MTGDIEYHDAMIRMLELVWGEGYMAPGGPGKVDDLVRGLKLRGRRVLDIGSGLGGPACHLAEKYRALVTGIDIEPQLVAKSRKRARQQGLQSEVAFLLVQPGPLPFPERSFDVVVSSGAFTQIADKQSLFAECHRVLEPRGYLHVFDWTTPLEETSEELAYFFEMEGLTYALETPAKYRQMLETTGFRNIRIDDDTPWYRSLCREEYEAMRGDLYPRMVELLGQADADHFVEDWRSLVVVFEKGHLTQTVCRARKPS